MKKQPDIFIEHILESIKLIEEYTEGSTKDDFIKSVKLQDLVMRKLEIIGEAVKYLPEDFKQIYTDVPWKEMSLSSILCKPLFC